jgi:Cdc6-like AAA superfamily ATPase
MAWVKMLVKGREDIVVAEGPGTAAIPVAEPEAPGSVASRNRHVADAIRAYCRFPYPQRYALMVNGKWGSGKTHLLLNVAESLIERSLSGDSNKPLYITLYGVKHPDEIAEQLYTATRWLVVTRPEASRQIRQPLTRCFHSRLFR